MSLCRRRLATHANDLVSLDSHTQSRALHIHLHLLRPRPLWDRHTDLNMFERLGPAVRQCCLLCLLTRTLLLVCLLYTSDAADE